ncbi:MAG: hypothetical protein HY787_00550 [Deltaproteobacteria bacterium]|nr:hypothetical protein [Deltaproteobacteria bacterium]
MNGRLDSLVDMIADVKDQVGKPVISIITYYSLEELPLVKEAVRKFQGKGIPTFPSIERGAVALKNAFDYYRMRDSFSSE